MLAQNRFCFILRTVACESVIARSTSSGSLYISTTVAVSTATSVPAPMATRAIATSPQRQHSTDAVRPPGPPLAPSPAHAGSGSPAPTPRRRAVSIAGQQVYIVSPEDLILSKLDWARDSRSQLQLDDVRNLLRTVEGLDREYLTRWAEALGLTALYREVSG